MQPNGIEGVHHCRGNFLAHCASYLIDLLADIVYYKGYAMVRRLNRLYKLVYA